MRKLIVLLAALCFFGMAQQASATAVWRHFGVDKAYVTKAEAIADAPRAMRRAGWPEPVIHALVAEMKHSGTRAHVVNGEHLDFMRSGKTAEWRNVLVKFDKPPIAESMEYDAPSEEWHTTWHGVVWTVGIPDVCRNTYGIQHAAQTPRVIRKTEIIREAPACIRVDAWVPAGEVRSLRFTLVRHTPVENFNCWGVIERTWRTGSPHNCDSCVWVDAALVEMHRRYGGTFAFYHTSIYELHPDTDASGRNEMTEVTLVLPPEAREGGIAVCVEVDGDIRPAYLVLPTSWRGDSYQIPEDFFTSPQTIGSVVH